MFDSQTELAALVYQEHEDPDAVLREFAGSVGERGFRPVGLIQAGHRRIDAPSLSAMLIHTGTIIPLYQELGSGAAGCKLDVAQLLDAANQVAHQIEDGADVVIINRYGKQECKGKGLSNLIDRAIESDLPVVVAVPDHRFSEWIAFSGGMSVRLPCTKDALNAWWETIAAPAGPATPAGTAQPTFCEMFK